MKLNVQQEDDKESLASTRNPFKKLVERKVPQNLMLNPGKPMQQFLTIINGCKLESASRVFSSAARFLHSLQNSKFAAEHDPKSDVAKLEDSERARLKAENTVENMNFSLKAMEIELENARGEMKAIKTKLKKSEKIQLKTEDELCKALAVKHMSSVNERPPPEQKSSIGNLRLQSNKEQLLKSGEWREPPVFKPPKSNFETEESKTQPHSRLPERGKNTTENPISDQHKAGKKFNLQDRSKEKESKLFTDEVERQMLQIPFSPQWWNPKTLEKSQDSSRNTV